MKINLPFFKCEVYGDGAWFRFGILGGFSTRDRSKNNVLLYSQRKGNTLRIGKYTIHRLNP